MAVSEVLKGLRQSSYGNDEPEKKESGSSERVLELSPEEMKSLGAPSEQDIVVQVTGHVGEGCFYVTSVKGPGGEQDVNADAEAVMQKMRPMQMQTVPSPS